MSCPKCGYPTAQVFYLDLSEDLYSGEPSMWLDCPIGHGRLIIRASCVDCGEDLTMQVARAMHCELLDHWLYFPIKTAFKYDWEKEE